MWEEYRFVDVWLIVPKGKRPMKKWRRIEKDGIQDWVDANEGALGYFSTIQSFEQSVKTDGEAHWSPLFFDLDANILKEDSSEEVKQKLQIALDDAGQVTDYFATGFDIIPEVYFSGGKGFHITVPGEFYGATPNNKLTYHWKHVASRIVSKLKVTTHDWSVYTVARQWRVANTRHASGLYKTPLEIADLHKGIDYVLSLAAEPRVLLFDDEEDPPDTLKNLADIYNEAVEEYSERQKIYDHESLESPVFGKEHPLCVKYLLENGLGTLGTKNRADMALSNYCKANSYDITDAETFMADWSKSIPLHLTHTQDPMRRVVQTLSVLRTVYSSKRYKYSCGSMLACEIDVNCEQCNVKQESEILTIKLSDFAIASHHGRRVCVEADVVGRDSSEMIVPKEILGWCKLDPESTACSRCKMSKFINEENNRVERTIVFDSSQKLTIELVDITQTHLRHRIKRIFGVEDRCYNFDYDVTFGNANILYLASRISGEFVIEEQIVRSRAIYLDHSMELNQSYNLFGHVWNHPRTNHAILLIDSAEMLKSSLRTFVLPKERCKEFALFQPGEGQSVLDKIQEIHKAFEVNFIRVYGRPELIMGVDLVFHSCRRFNFQKVTGLKGWLDILILGDTRQGKSETAEKIMEYYQLGVMAAGETTSRTGLLYTIHMVAGEEAWVAFGLLCRANGYLVVVDEMHDMPTQDFKEFTQARSKGVVDVKRAAYGVARCETRIISVANARAGKSLDSYSYPVMAIPDIPCFKDLADVARFDFCVGVRAGDVSDDVINKDAYEIEDVENPYTADLCRDLILWLWTRTPEQIYISRETEKVILKIAKELGADYVPDIPLIESADVRYKIARIAIAVAGRVYSTDDHEILIVKPEHAVTARNILESFYKSPSLNYYGWSDDRRRIEISPERMDVLKFDFQQEFIMAWATIAQWILDVNQFNKSLLKASTGLPSSGVDALMAFLITNRFIIADRYNYIKTPSGREFLQSMIDVKRGEERKDESPEVEEQAELEEEF